MRIRLLPPNSPFGWLPYAWLVYLSLFVAYTFMSRPSPALWAVYGVALVVFLALYFRGFWLEGRKIQPIICGITAIGAVLIPANPGASAFFVYAAAFACDVGPARMAWRWLGGIIALVAAETLLLHLPSTAWVPGILVSLIVGGGNIQFAEKRRANTRLRLAQAEVEHLAKVAERERIARDLHDLLGHTLSVIVLKSELAAKIAERDPRRAAAEIRDVERISREALVEVRRAVQGYRELTLEESLARAREALMAANIEMHCDIAPIRFDARCEAVVSLVVREAITNVIRHSRASRCWLRLAHTDATVQMEIGDDGVGGRAVSGTGLAGMQARIEELGGTLRHDGTKGTLLQVSLPAEGGRLVRTT